MSSAQPSVLNDSQVSPALSEASHNQYQHNDTSGGLQELTEPAAFILSHLLLANISALQICAAIVPPSSQPCLSEM